jgi:hypothetical protein
MKHLIAASLIFVTVSGMAQSSSSQPVDFNQYTHQPLIQARQPDYFGEVIKPTHKVRNRILIGSAVAAGVAATVLLSHDSHASVQPNGVINHGVIHGVIK